jgi:alkylhydroperoxidase family enzyme
MLRFLEKLTLTPDAVVPADAAEVLAAGVSRQAFLDALHVQGIFALITRCADAFNFYLPSDEGYLAGAKGLLRFGYKL